MEDDYYPPRRNGIAKVVVAIVVILASAILALGAEKRFHVLERVEAAFHGGPAETEADPRAAAFLTDGERALVAGDLDAAQTAFDKASVLTSGDARVALDLARVGAAKADIAWLKLRLLSSDAIDEARVLRGQLMDHAAASMRSAQDALAAHADDPQAIAAKIDAMRLAGQPDAARSSVVAVFGKSTEPEIAYVLAALEMTQTPAPWPSIVDRLRLAAGSEWNPGRARSALVYALVRAGDLPGARTEMGRLEGLARPYPCLPDLRALLAASDLPALPAVAVVTDAGAGDAGRDAGGAKTGSAAAGGNAPSYLGPQGGGSEEPGDITPQGSPLVAANQAMAVHDYGRAEQIYQGILTNNPNDSQALSGLADIERARGDKAAAINTYKRAVAVNPSYLPALLGLADTQYFAGDKAAAISGYKNIEDHFPEGSYPEYVKARASGQ
jgi:tetratricopeptide (TPR) repeat protein